MPLGTGEKKHGEPPGKSGHVNKTMINHIFGVVFLRTHETNMVILGMIYYGGLEHIYIFHILGLSSSQLTFIFFRGVGLPPTR